MNVEFANPTDAAAEARATAAETRAAAAETRAAAAETRAAAAETRAAAAEARAAAVEARAAAANALDAETVPAIPEGAHYANAKQVAARLGVGAQYVGERPTQMGATPLSDTSNSKLNYHLPTADAWMAARRRELEPVPTHGSGGRKVNQPDAPTHTRSGVLLLKVV